jgi:uncharacterized membrane protein YfcA
MYALALALSLLIGLALGLLGGGGSILTLPILVYALGVPDRQAIAASLVIVGTTSLAALLQHARAGNVAWRTGLVFGAAGMAGAFGGGLLAQFVPERVLLLMFSAMMLATALAMFRGRRSPRAQVGSHSTARIVLDGLVVGVVTGLVGAGGGFLVVPALVLLGGLPMQKAVGTSLLVIAMKSFAGYLGHATHESIDWLLTATIAGTAVIGSLLGGLLAPHVPADTLRKAFAGFVLVMAFFQIYQQL